MVRKSSRAWSQSRSIRASSGRSPMRAAAPAMSRTSASAWSMARATRSVESVSAPAMPFARIGSSPKAAS